MFVKEEKLLVWGMWDTIKHNGNEVISSIGILVFIQHINEANRWINNIRSKLSQNKKGICDNEMWTVKIKHPIISILIDYTIRKCLEQPRMTMNQHKMHFPIEINMIIISWQWRFHWRRSNKNKENENGGIEGWFNNVLNLLDINLCIFFPF